MSSDVGAVAYQYEVDYVDKSILCITHQIDINLRRVILM